LLKNPLMFSSVQGKKLVRSFWLQAQSPLQVGSLQQERKPDKDLQLQDIGKSLKVLFSS